MVYPALLPLMRTPRLPVVDWTDATASLNGLVRFAERRNLVSGACAVTFQTQSTERRPTEIWHLAGERKGSFYRGAKLQRLMNINTVIGQGRDHEDGRALVHRHILSYYFLYDAVSVSYCIASKGKTSDCYSKTNQMHQCIKFILFWNDTLHVSDGLSVHHQQFKTVHTATKQILLTAC